MTLHGYFRSSSAWRVRIALNLKNMEAAHVPHHLRHGGQRSADYLRLNPQGLVPALVLDDGSVLTQSLAICEYLDEIRPEPPLLPADPIPRAHARAFAQAIACDTHPLQNLKVLNRLRAIGADEAAVNGWAAEVIDEGLSACDALLSDEGSHFCFGEQPSLADICLVPQIGNARRFGVALRWTKLLAIEAHCLALPAFAEAAPSAQADAE